MSPQESDGEGTTPRGDGGQRSGPLGNAALLTAQGFGRVSNWIQLVTEDRKQERAADTNFGPNVGKLANLCPSQNFQNCILQIVSIAKKGIFVLRNLARFSGVYHRSSKRGLGPGLRPSLSGSRRQSGVLRDERTAARPLDLRGPVRWWLQAQCNCEKTHKCNCDSSPRKYLQH